MTTPVYIGCDDAAIRLGTSAEWVRRQCKAKVIVAVKLGRAYRIDERDLETFMRKYRGGDAPAARPRLKGSKRRVA